MQHDSSSAMPGHNVTRHRPLWPTTRLGSIALVCTGAALVVTPLAPLVTVLFRDVFPIVDTWVQPFIVIVVVDAAAILGVLAVWRARERSLMNIVALVVMATLGLFFTYMGVGEAIMGV